MKLEDFNGHTPGPWKVDDAPSPFKYREGEHYHEIVAPTPLGINNKYPYAVADTSNRHYAIDPEEDRANARLMAASTRLLGALKNLRTHWLQTIECNHEAKTDRAVCACGVWVSSPQPNVGQAVERWIEHVMESV